MNEGNEEITFYSTDEDWKKVNDLVTSLRGCLGSAEKRIKFLEEHPLLMTDPKIGVINLTELQDKLVASEKKVAEMERALEELALRDELLKKCLMILSNLSDGIVSKKNMDGTAWTATCE